MIYVVVGNIAIIIIAFCYSSLVSLFVSSATTFLLLIGRARGEIRIHFHDLLVACAQ